MEKMTLERHGNAPRGWTDLLPVRGRWLRPFLALAVVLSCWLLFRGAFALAVAGAVLMTSALVRWILEEVFRVEQPLTRWISTLMTLLVPGPVVFVWVLALLDALLLPLVM